MKRPSIPKGGNASDVPGKRRQSCCGDSASPRLMNRVNAANGRREEPARAVADRRRRTTFCNQSRSSKGGATQNAFLLWLPAMRKLRRLPRFKTLVRDRGLVDSRRQ